MPPIEVLKQTFSSADEKGKATAVIDEGIRPLDGQFRKAASYSTNDESATHDSAANATKPNPQGTAPRVMTDRELLLSLHQKVDRNHKWVKRQFGSILHNMTATHNAVKKNHYYLHETLNRTWAVLSHIYGEEDLKKMGLKEDLDWAAPPPKKYKKVLPWWPAPILHRATPTSMKTWTTLRQAQHQQTTPTTLARLHQHDILQGR